MKNFVTALGSLRGHHLNKVVTLSLCLYPSINQRLMFHDYLSQNVLILSLLLTSFCHTLSPFKQPAWAAAATASARTKAVRIENRWIPPKLTPHEANLPNRKKTSSNTAPTAPTLSILSTSAARNFRTTILSRCQCPVYYKFFILAVSSSIRLITSSNDRLRSS